MGYRERTHITRKKGSKKVLQWKKESKIQEQTHMNSSDKIVIEYEGCKILKK